MQKKVRDYISSCHMLTEGEQVIAAVSGGADSVCLLHLLVGLREELHISVSAVHVHHGIRGEEADRDAAFTEELCGAWGVPCLVVRRDVPGYAAERSLSLEEAGRMLRYEVFREEAKRLGGAKIAVAHHRDDQAETILHNLLRGSSLKGIGGMAPVREDIIRPLLTSSREEILGYLEQQGLACCEDSTNNDSDYTRNRLRNHIIPELVREINPGAVEHIIRAGDMIGQADAYIKKVAVRELEIHGQWEEQRVGMEIEAFRGLDEIVRNYIIMEMMGGLAGSRKDLTSRHVSLVRGLPEREVGARLNLPYGLTARRSYTKLWIERENEVTSVENLPEMELPAPVYTRFDREKHHKFPENEYTKWFDYDKIKGTLSVRTRQTGDYITLRDGKHKTVKSYMIDKKIDRELRDRIPLLADGNHILWIVGYRISEYYKITEETKQILQVQMDGGKDHGR